MNYVRKVLLGAALAASVFNFGVYAAGNRAKVNMHGVSFEYINESILNDLARLEAMDSSVAPVALVDQDNSVPATVNYPEIGFNVPTVVSKIQPLENGRYKVVFDTGRVVIVASWIAVEALIAGGLYTNDMVPMMSTLSQVLTFGSVASVGSAAVQAVLPKSGEKRKRA